MKHIRIVLAAALAFCPVLVGCVPSSVITAPPAPSPTPSPTPSAAPGAVTLNPASFAFTNVGAGSAQTVAASQMNYSGTFTASTTTCSGIASIATVTASSFAVTPLAAGSCAFAISGGAGKTATLAISVTTTTVGGH